MNFFEQQHVARRNSRWMVVLFVLSVIGVVVVMDFFIATLCVVFFNDVPEGGRLDLRALYLAVPLPIYLWGAIVTFALIVAESIRHTWKLRAGGPAIAAAFGARRVASGTTDPLERRLLNVVEEMSIAAGVRVPAVYVLDKEAGINAFAAGLSVSDAIITVTGGALQALTRDELQGVIGHEFSHILNGDMSLNLRMLGVLGGIVVIGSLGLFILRVAFEADDLRGFLAFFAVGAVVCIIGYTGLFFARLIKAAVSREREFLADSASVQFTRNPDGIAGALEQIRSSERGARIRHRYAEEVSHMFFGQSIAVVFDALFATHPLIDERIRRVNPAFEPARYRMVRGAEAAAAAQTQPTEPPAGAVSFAAAMQQPGDARAGDAAREWRRSGAESAGLVGTLDADKVDVAQRLLASLPPDLREGLRSAEGAACAVLALLLASNDHVRNAQLAAMRAAGASHLADAVEAVAKDLRDLGPALHLPVVDLALPALKGASAQAKNELLLAMVATIEADRRVSMHEFAMLTLMRSQLARQVAVPKSKRLAATRSEAGLVLSLVAHAGAGQAQREYLEAFRAGAKEMGLEELQPAVRDSIQLEAVADALEALRGLAPRDKASLVQGLFAAVSADGSIRVVEAELMRMVGAVLDCPLPPLLDERGPAAGAASLLKDYGDWRRATGRPT